MRETIERKQTTFLELAAMVIKQSILCEIVQADMIELVDELADYRAKELVTTNKEINYTKSIEAFTCEICCDRLYIIKHNNINSALIYAAQNIGDISIVFDDNVVVIGGYQDDFIYWGFNNDSTMYKIQIGEKTYEEKNYNGIIYSTVNC